jgi:hypothetical protein
MFTFSFQPKKCIEFNVVIFLVLQILNLIARRAEYTNVGKSDLMFVDPCITVQFLQ